MQISSIYLTQIILVSSKNNVTRVDGRNACNNPTYRPSNVPKHLHIYQGMHHLVVRGVAHPMASMNSDRGGNTREFITSPRTVCLTACSPSPTASPPWQGRTDWTRFYNLRAQAPFQRPISLGPSSCFL